MSQLPAKQDFQPPAEEMDALFEVPAPPFLQSLSVCSSMSKAFTMSPRFAQTGEIVYGRCEQNLGTKVLLWIPPPLDCPSLFNSIKSPPEGKPQFCCRPLATESEKDGAVYKDRSYDITSNLFQAAMRETKNRNYKFGVEFLLWSPDLGRFATFWFKGMLKQSHYKKRKGTTKILTEFVHPSLSDGNGAWFFYSTIASSGSGKNWFESVFELVNDLSIEEQREIFKLQSNTIVSDYLQSQLPSQSQFIEAIEMFFANPDEFNVDELER